MSAPHLADHPPALRRRRRPAPTQDDMCRALRAARAEGWPGGVSVEHDGERTIVRLYQGDAPSAPAPVARGPSIYFIRCGGFIKIGKADDPESRLTKMRTDNPLDLELLHAVPGDFDLERQLHKRFAAYHHRREWFRYEGELAAWLDAQTRVA